MKKLYVAAGLLLSVFSHPTAVSGRNARTVAVSISAPGRHITKQQKEETFDRFGITKNQRNNYEVDYVIPPELGGPSTPLNLMVLSKADAPRRRKVARYLARKVKRGEVGLLAAQAAMRNWQAISTK